ncbi:hypothetical protein DZA65_02307 [Dickeya dianthicola]|nr:hypothetical protein DZA65_02307 [Dickeya dianthicola]
MRNSASEKRQTPLENNLTEARAAVRFDAIVDYILLMMSWANSLHLRSVAPSISRSKS